MFPPDEGWSEAGILQPFPFRPRPPHSPDRPGDSVHLACIPLHLVSGSSTGRQSLAVVGARPLSPVSLRATDRPLTGDTAHTGSDQLRAVPALLCSVQ